MSAGALVERGALRPGCGGERGQGWRPETGSAFRVRKGHPGWKSHSRRVAGTGKQAMAEGSEGWEGRMGAGRLASHPAGSLDRALAHPTTAASLEGGSAPSPSAPMGLGQG